jgi:hypothetical protein
MEQSTSKHMNHKEKLSVHVDGIHTHSSVKLVRTKVLTSAVLDGSSSIHKGPNVGSHKNSSVVHIK